VTGGIAMGGTMLIAGPLYASQGGHAYWAMMLVAAVGLAAALVLQRSVSAQRQSAHPHS
jgi:hypothetical protein